MPSGPRPSERRAPPADPPGKKHRRPGVTAPEEDSPGSAGYRLMPLLRLAQRLGSGDPGSAIREALQRAGYARHRPSFAAPDVRAVLAAHPELLEAWLAYSEAKATAEGWYVLRDGEIGQLHRPAAQRQFATIEQAVAEFIVRELDHYAGVVQIT